MWMPLPPNLAQRLLLTLLGLQLATATAHALALQGMVQDASGRPLAGLFVTTLDAQAGMTQTVYTDAQGRFQFPDGIPPPAHIRIHHPRYQALQLPMVASGDLGQVTLQAAEDPMRLASTAAWFARVPDSPEKREFLLNCASCHEISATRIFKDGKLRDRSAWHAGISMMKALDVYAVIPPDFDTEHYADWASRQFTAEQVATLEAQQPADAVLAEEKVLITEYPVPEATELPHDLVFGPDGRVWVTGFWTSQIWAMDVATGHFEHFEVNAEPDTVAQVRALEFDTHGKLWVVNGGTSAVVKLDPATRTYETFKVGMYPHDIVLDSDGNAWVNDYFAKKERVARVGATDGKVEVFPLPSLERPAAEGVPLSYGLQIDAEDRLWSTQLAANTLIRHDIRTGKSHLYSMPDANTGPRRNAIGLDGRIWIPEFNTGRLTAFDPVTETFETFDTGIGAAGIYDVAVDPRSGDVWLAASLASELIRFDIRRKVFVHYPLPTEPAYMRHLAIDARTGDVWSAYSSLPTATPRVVRLQRTATAR
ncbi:MAG: hypothetical protein RL434_572 [Pseudomonadota bacterium]